MKASAWSAPLYLASEPSPSALGGASSSAKLYPCFFTTAVMVHSARTCCRRILKHHDGCHTQLGRAQGHSVESWLSSACAVAATCLKVCVQ